MFLQNDYKCSICRKRVKDSNLPVFFPHYVCPDCDEKALLDNGRTARDWHSGRVEQARIRDPFGYKDVLSQSDTGPNPVYIDGKKCWRRYRMGTWVTMKDVYNSKSLEEFEMNNFRR